MIIMKISSNMLTVDLGFQDSELVMNYLESKLKKKWDSNYHIIRK